MLVLHADTLSSRFNEKAAILEIWSRYIHEYLFTPVSFIALNFTKQV